MADHPDALSSREEIAEKAVAVRQELKTWEKEFAASNGGRKAGRDDIKQNPHIAQKYKEYGQIKNLEAKLNRRANRQAESAQPESQSKKRKHASPSGPGDAPPSATPRKASKGLFATPSQPRTEKIHPSNLDPYDSPSTFRKLFSPSTHRQSMPAPSPLKAAIGPTPQRDGKSLGLFDLLSESGGSHRATPSVSRQKDALAAGFQTPSKPKTFDPIKEAPEGEEESVRITRTPASSTKQFYLANLFATPTTMRYAAMVEADDEKEAQASANHKSTEQSPETNHSATPSFLRRSNSGRYPAPSNRDGSGLSPIKSRQPGRFHGKGLSTIVQGLRDMEEEMEEERMDDDWDVMREMEAEEDAFSYPVPQANPAPEKPYKKKGQKRTTRRVTMRPVIRQAKSREEQNVEPPEEDSEDELAADVVPETQVQAGSHEIPPEILEGGEDGDDLASLHTVSEPESEDDEPEPDSDGDPEYGEKPKPLPKAKSFSERLKEAVSKAKPTSKEPAPVPVKATKAKEEKQPKERKVNPQAHANYRSLKIHNRGSRGGGRFRRR